jgi:hypothetical protein
MTLNNIGTIFEDNDEYWQAFPYVEQATGISRHTLSFIHPNMIYVEQNIKCIPLKLN